MRRRVQRISWLAIVLLASACAGDATRHEPEPCTYWTEERMAQYEAMVLAGDYPAVARLVVEWDEACSVNASYRGEPWPERKEPRRWWEIWKQRR